MQNCKDVFLNNLNGLFRIALLITGDIDSAESALTEAVGAWSEFEPLTYMVLCNSMTFAVARSSVRILRQANSVSNSEAENALALVHEELHPVFELPPDLRCCFVLRILAGYTREQVGRLMDFQSEAIEILAQTALVRFATLTAKRRRKVAHFVPAPSQVRLLEPNR